MKLGKLGVWYANYFVKIGRHGIKLNMKLNTFTNSFNIFVLIKLNFFFIFFHSLHNIKITRTRVHFYERGLNPVMCLIPMNSHQFC